MAKTAELRDFSLKSTPADLSKKIIKLLGSIRFELTTKKR
jgi:hypothetical protein